MVVDDQADVRFLLRMVLEDAGDDIVLVAEAGSGAEALATIADVAPDVVVLDARMPIMDGFEAAPELLERRPGTPIVLLSAHVDDEVRRQAEAAGIARCLSKDAFNVIPGVIRELADP